MTRIRPLTEQEVAPEQQVYFRRSRDAFGTVLNSTGVYAHCPPIQEAAQSMGAAMEKSGQLPRQLRCLLNVRAASMVGCPF